MPILVIDTNVLRYALEAEKELREDKEVKIAYIILAKLLNKENIIIVANPSLIKEYSRHIEAIRRSVGKKRGTPSFLLLRLIKQKMKKVPREEHFFEFTGEPIGRKDYHLLESAKTGALMEGEKEAYILTFAEDVYRAKEAKNGEGVTIKVIDMKKIRNSDLGIQVIAKLLSENF
ncbi:hypothetical protein [Pyrococcus kukulkanii]|uniref:PIN domain-containing protein n=1 Tax=Pyrococcus kukulkanii TaxID=1609559 RepID=A0ABV4T4R5_9EURY